MKGYPGWFFSLLLVTLLVEAVSGLMLIPTTLDMKFAMRVPWRMMGDLQLNVIFLHSLSAYILMCCIGALAPIHMRSGIRQHKHMVLGLSLLTLFIVLMLSALGLLYLADEDLINLSAVLHLAAGVAVIVNFAFHYVIVQKHKGEKNPHLRRAKR